MSICWILLLTCEIKRTERAKDTPVCFPVSHIGGLQLWEGEGYARVTVHPRDRATVRTQVCWCPGAHIHAPASNPTEPGLLPTTCVCIYPGFPSKCHLQMPFQSIKQLNYFPKFNLMVWCQLTAGCGFPVSESRIIFILGFGADGSITVVGAREGLDEHARFVHKADLQRSVIRLSSALKTAGLNDTLAFSWFQTGWTL